MGNYRQTYKLMISHVMPLIIVMGARLKSDDAFTTLTIPIYCFKASKSISLSGISPDKNRLSRCWSRANCFHTNRIKYSASFEYLTSKLLQKMNLLRSKLNSSSLLSWKCAYSLRRFPTNDRRSKLGALSTQTSHRYNDLPPPTLSHGSHKTTLRHSNQAIHCS